MHTSIQRVQNITGFFTSAVGILAVVISITSIIQLYFSGSFNVSSSVSSVKPKAYAKYTRRFGSIDGKVKHNYRLNFDLSSDLSPLFNWNTKQIFVYLTAEYEGKREDINNRVTFWDKIITKKEDAVFNLKNVKSSYNVYDIGRTLQNKNATIRLEWNLQPHIGPLLWGETIAAKDTSFVFPQLL